ncbi:MAG: hypothetical protein BWY85_01356 [Firmicutes bacterium ADurb.Bin506]|jgi:hypothetical protein|nr:MAG: hypothetical protein BWY85_01356 [Firmicutes bacterium ADurb.Bin506]
MKSSYPMALTGKRRERARQVDGAADDRSWVVQEIRRVCEQLDQAEHCFDMASEQQMIDAAIYTMRACECRLSYLFGLAGRARASGAEADGVSGSSAPEVGG